MIDKLYFLSQKKCFKLKGTVQSKQKYYVFYYCAQLKHVVGQLINKDDNIHK